MSEAAFVEVVERAGDLLATKFNFGSHTPEDFRQMVAVWAIEAMQRYRPEAGSLESFVYAHSRNRLQNLMRDTVRRNDLPCRVCHLAVTTGSRGHDDGELCEHYRKWQKRNTTKASLAQPLGVEHLFDHHEPRTGGSTAEADAETTEILQLIDTHLPVAMRADYLRARSGTDVPRQRRRIVEQEVLRILREKGGLDAEDLHYTALPGRRRRTETVGPGSTHLAA